MPHTGPSRRGVFSWTCDTPASLTLYYGARSHPCRMTPPKGVNPLMKARKTVLASTHCSSTPFGIGPPNRRPHRHGCLTVVHALQNPPTRPTNLRRQQETPRRHPGALFHRIPFVDPVGFEIV